MPVAAASLAIIRQQVARYPPEAFFPTDRERRRFLEFLRPRPGLSARLTEMHECGLLCALFPEFQALSGRMMRDASHPSGVDTRTLLAIHQLERLLAQTTLSGERFGSMLRELNALAREFLGLVGGEAHMDGAFDKMFCRMHDRRFPLRLLPPYASATDETFERFAALVREKYPRWVPA